MKGGQELFRTPEEIRKDIGISQTEFCKRLDIAYRTYHERLSGHRPIWSIVEVAKFCKVGNGNCKIILDGVEYDVSIKQI